jgi:DNA-binding response OmpR family regulator
MAKGNDKILIIEDQPSVRFGLRKLLEDEGYRVLEAETGEHAIAVVTESAPQLILLDLRLPDANGLDLLTSITALSKRPSLH